MGDLSTRDRGTLREAAGSMALQVARLGDWERRHGADHDPGGIVPAVMGLLRALELRLARVGDDTPAFASANEHPKDLDCELSTAAEASASPARSACPCNDPPLVIFGQGDYRREICDPPPGQHIDVTG